MKALKEFTADDWRKRGLACGFAYLAASVLFAPILIMQGRIVYAWLPYPNLYYESILRIPFALLSAIFFWLSLRHPDSRDLPATDRAMGKLFMPLAILVAVFGPIYSVFYLTVVLPSSFPSEHIGVVRVFVITKYAVILSLTCAICYAFFRQISLARTLIICFLALIVGGVLFPIPSNNPAHLVIYAAGTQEISSQTPPFRPEALVSALLYNLLEIGALAYLIARHRWVSTAQNPEETTPSPSY